MECSAILKVLPKTVFVLGKVYIVKKQKPFLKLITYDFFLQDPAGCSLSAKHKAYYRRAKARAGLGYGMKVGGNSIWLSFSL